MNAILKEALEFDFSQHFALCSPLNLGSEGRKQTSSQAQSQDASLPLFTL